jgi:hypothetical protein
MDGEEQNGAGKEQDVEKEERNLNGKNQDVVLRCYDMGGKNKSVVKKNIGLDINDKEMSYFIADVIRCDDDVIGLNRVLILTGLIVIGGGHIWI